MMNSLGRSWGAVRVVAALGALACLPACSGTGAATPARATASALPAGPCDKAGFTAHAGLAAGAIQTLVWQPVRSGALKRGAHGRAAAIDRAQQASALAARELQAAAPLVAGCPGGTRLSNALATGRSLATSASKQLASQSVNQLTLAGANSITTTVLQEARTVGIAVTPVKPTVKQLTAPAAG